MPAVGSLSIWLPPYLPEELVNDSLMVDGIDFLQVQSTSDLMLDVSSDALVSQWVFVLAAPFSTIESSVSSSNLRAIWSGSELEDIPLKKILVDGSTKALFAKLWGPTSNQTVSVRAKDELLSSTWEEEGSWALIPFEQLVPQWKVIALDGQSPLDKSLDLDRYPLVIPFSVVGSAEHVSDFQSGFGRGSSRAVFPSTNWDAGKFTNVMVTGVTCLSRCTAFLMEINGTTYPAIDIGDLLRSADILHISNEAAFSSTCVISCTPENDKLEFCSKPEYINLLEAVGTDVVEMTGDHFIDTDAASVLDTIAKYEQRGWKYYGGGKNYEDGIRPALFEVNGNKIAFLGCNAKGRGYAAASETSPGAVHCNMELMADKIRDVVSKGYLPIFTFQHVEYYSYKIDESLIPDFHAAADAGAVIVSGSQAHMPHGFEFYKGAFLHYGLGNLFFDQYRESLEQRDAFIDEYIFYDGLHINTRLITIKFIDYARTRFMTPEERNELLAKVFKASGW